MKKLLFIILCCCSSYVFGQKGFYLLPEAGIGFTNARMPGSSHFYGHTQLNNITSIQGQLGIGYKTGRWQFSSGIGFLRTGMQLTGSALLLRRDIAITTTFPELLVPMVIRIDKITTYNPHITVPVKIGYEAYRFNNKLKVTPAIGAELAYNTRRTFTYAEPNFKDRETQVSFNYNCNRLGVIGLVQVNLEYKLNNRCDLVAGPSFRYMFSSMLNYAQEHDYAVLMNVGIRYNFRHKGNLTTTTAISK